MPTFRSLRLLPAALLLVPFATGPVHAQPPAPPAAVSAPELPAAVKTAALTRDANCDDSSRRDLCQLLGRAVILRDTVKATPGDAPVSEEVVRGVAALAKDSRPKAADLRRAMVELADVEAALRAKGETILSLILMKKKQKSEMQDLSGQAGANAAQAPDLDKLEADLKAIKEMTSFRDDETTANFTDYDDFFARLNMGYEFVNLNSTFEKGLPRVNLLINQALFGRTVNEMTRGFHPGQYGFRICFDASLTSSAEQDIDASKLGSSQQASRVSGAADPATPDTPTPDPATTPDVKKTLLFSIQVFYPFYRTQLRKPQSQWLYFGLVVDGGGRKTEDISRLDARYYAGFRFAFNPEQYWDLVYGRTESLRSHRIELRGQLPIYRPENGDRIYLGAIGNFGLGSTARTRDESDVIRIYLSWHVDLPKLFANKPQG